MKEHAIIFDLDGTLLNTIEDIANLTNLALNQHGLPPNDLSNYQKMVGHGLKDLVRKAVPINTDNKTIDLIYKTLIHIYIENPVQKTFAYEGINDLLYEMNRLNIPMAILSNKMHEITKKIVSVVFKDFNFVDVIGARDNIPKKPDPFSALEICSKFSILPENVFMIGDSSTDIKTAKSAGMHPLGVSWGYRFASEIKEAGAIQIFEKPIEILDYFKSVNIESSISNI